ncbi:hypothetical protein Poli38472_004376 [Pythium oligandrum]|uniref:Enoyl reductase (ER) domain-containing protein n=1 Tax=Pythium oligandrum TaxID=41045 RepID=A0A8K1CBE8_PYTOL|nr:hypothetical protein Poli38472_004376 [Pythium oligandrum]|eukprot:TMW59307.1 hypothetical protein Poli38472_004376 [Pythium oligandrum]
MPSYRAISVRELSSDFRAATEIVHVPELPVAGAGDVVVKNHYVGVNASDINITKGAYGVTNVPFVAGLEAVGVVTEVGEGVSDVKVGDAVAYYHIGAFAEYVQLPATKVLKVPEPVPAMLPITVCGISVSIALEQAGEMKSGETVLITSAAGGSGQMAVQLAKLAGNHVIGTCSSDEKVEHLKKLGCDRVINYKKEKVDEVLKNEYPKGVNLVLESVGGEMLQAAVENVAPLGRVVVFGVTSEYQDGQNNASVFSVSALTRVLLGRSASLRGANLGTFTSLMSEHIARLLTLVQEGKLEPGVDPTPYQGLEQIPDAIDRMYARQNVGKLIVKLV